MIYYLGLTIALIIIIWLLIIRRSEFILGVLAFMIAGVGLFHGYFSPLPKVEDYDFKKIEYHKCYFDRHENELILESGNEKYSLDANIIRTTTDRDNGISCICRNSEAVVWISRTTNNNKIVRGFENTSLKIPIEIGMQKDDPRQAIIIGWIFFSLGFALIFVAFILGKLIWGFVNF